MEDPNMNRINRQTYLRKAIDDTIRSLGGPISKTISWHMNNRGVLSDSKALDINLFYLNLQDLIGPGADMIMEETWERLTHQLKESRMYKDGPVIDRISKFMKTGVEA